MNPENDILRLDKQHVWHPFAPNSVWLDPAFQPVVIERGEGSWLIASDGTRYLDGNASIWTNLHGHNHPTLNNALIRQLGRIAHSSFLGLTNDQAPPLAARLARLSHHPLLGSSLDRIFFSDDGSTAMETAVKIVTQFFQQNGQPERRRFVSLGSAYHGDTLGAMSVGHSGGFHRNYRHLLFDSTEVMSPACYRCPHNRAAPEKTDARTTRQCHWECVGEAEKKLTTGPAPAAWVLEPVVQGAAGMVMHPHGYLEKTGRIARQAGARIILDEVMTGCARTGPFFAHHREAIQPDAVALAKGLSGGYLPFAATLVAEDLFAGFNGGIDRTFFHGHSYTGNQLGAAAATASLDLLDAPGAAEKRAGLAALLSDLSRRFWQHPHVGDVRCEGLILGIELVADFATRRPFAPDLRTGWHVCERARHYHLLTRPVGDVLVLMPPYSTTPAELEQMIDALFRALYDVLPAETA